MLPMPTISAIQIGLEAVNGTEEKARSKPDGRYMKANPVVMPRAARFDSVMTWVTSPAPAGTGRERFGCSGCPALSSEMLDFPASNAVRALAPA